MPSLQNNHNCKLPDALLHWTRDHENTLELRFPVHRACRDGDINTLDHLLNSANLENNRLLEIQDPYLGWTPALWASFFGQLECVQRVSPAGLEPRSATGETVLHIAALGARPNLLHWLLQLGAPYHITDDKGETALHKAARSKSYECSRILAVCGADYSVRNKEGLTAAQVEEQEGGMLENNSHHEVFDCKQSALCHISSNAYYGYQSVISNTTDQKNGHHRTENGTNGHHMTENSTNGHHLTENGTNGVTNGFSSEDAAMDADDGHLELQMAIGHSGNGHHINMPSNGFSEINAPRKRCMQDCASVDAKRMRHEVISSAPEVDSENYNWRGGRHVKFNQEDIIIGRSSPVDFNCWPNNVELRGEQKDGATATSCRPRTPLEDVGNYANDLLRGTHGCDLYFFMRHDEL